MKLLRRAFGVGSSGHVKLVPENGEDMWHAYQLIRVGDQVTTSTTRKVTKDVSSDGSRTDTRKVSLDLTIKVVTINFDPEGQELRLSGPNVTESEHVKLGAYHTVTLETHHSFLLAKEQWDGFDADRIRLACDPGASADLACLLISDAVAHLLLVGSCTTCLKAKVETNLPAKRGAAALGYDKALKSYFSKVLAAVERQVNWDIVRCFVIAGPGTVKDSFLTFLEAEAARKDLRLLTQNKQKILVAHASSAYTQALGEVLGNETIAHRIKDTAAAQEVAALQEFLATLSKDNSCAFYGLGHVRAAAELGAVGKLLITDTLIRANTVQKRREYHALLKRVKSFGGTVLLFSGAHPSGVQLDRLTGVAALLRYPLPGLEDEQL